MINKKYFFKGLSCVKSFDSPAIALGCCMIAIGALFKNIGFNLKESVFSTFLTYALPGSLVMAETIIIGGSLQENNSIVENESTINIILAMPETILLQIISTTLLL